MCCLFGLVDPNHALAWKQKNRIISALAISAEARGTDATGIAYNASGTLCIYKRPVPAHRLSFRVPADATVIMGHTRMTTQGSAKRNRNNHPFEGQTADGNFALSHNGILYNDKFLRSSLHLPKTKIETDSYVAAQMIEQQGTLCFSSLRAMAEQVEGSFVFTALDEKNGLWFVKGDNPLCIYHDEKTGIYLYASTEEILKKALLRVRLSAKAFHRVPTECGELLRIDAKGTVTRSTFDDSSLCSWYQPIWHTPIRQRQRITAPSPEERSYLDEIKSVASAFGYTPESIDRLSEMGFTPEELEEFLYCGEL